MSELLAVEPDTVLKWRKDGLLESGPRVNDSLTLFKKPSDELLQKLDNETPLQKSKILRRLAKSRREVQYEG